MTKFAKEKKRKEIAAVERETRGSRTNHTYSGKRERGGRELLEDEKRPVPEKGPSWSSFIKGGEEDSLTKGVT